MFFRSKSIVTTVLMSVCFYAVPSAGSEVQPFFYYPAYGAHRGRIVYRQGPFGGSKQKVHWGGGITDNGAAVLTAAIGAAATIFGPGSAGESKEERAARDAAFQQRVTEEQDWLSKAKELQVITEELRARFINGQPQPPQLPPPPPPQQPGLDNFSNWDSNASAVPVPVVVPPPLSGPRDTFSDWDSNR